MRVTSLKILRKKYTKMEQLQLPEKQTLSNANGLHS